MFSGWKIAAGVGIIAAFAAGYAWLERSWRQTAELQVSIEQEANEQNRKTITLLRDQKELAEQIAKELSDQLAQINAKAEEEDAAIRELEKSDDDTKKFLNTPVPTRLRCLWGEKSQCGNQNGGSNTQ